MIGVCPCPSITDSSQATNNSRRIAGTWIKLSGFTMRESGELGRGGPERFRREAASSTAVGRSRFRFGFFRRHSERSGCKRDDNPMMTISRSGYHRAIIGFASEDAGEIRREKCPGSAADRP
jgi:hypothetical protein